MGHETMKRMIMVIIVVLFMQMVMMSRLTWWGMMVKMQNHDDGDHDSAENSHQYGETLTLAPLSPV